MQKIHKLAAWYASACMAVSSSVYAMAPQGNEDGRPQEHLCPISLSLMTDPVVASDGQSYDRLSIQGWFNARAGTAHVKSPVTGAMMDRTIVPNTTLKKMIADWKAGQAAVSSSFEGRSAADIAACVNVEFDKNKQLLEPAQTAKSHHIVAFLGNTGAGKSTLINLLAGKAIKVSRDRKNYVLMERADPSSMPIGIEGGSTTQYPKSIDVDVPGAGSLRFFDLPGFNDTDGSERNLVNAAFTRRILLEAASVRLVFVVGEDQFTADKAASVREMFRAVQRLFVVSGDNDDRMINDGLLVGSKILGDAGEDVIPFLLQRTNSGDKEALNAQLAAWRDAGRIRLFPHAIMNADLQPVRDGILRSMASLRAAKIRGINVSALYPPQTVHDLSRVFTNVMEEMFHRTTGRTYTTLSEYDGAIVDLSAPTFWDGFDADVCRQEGPVSLLKDFCFNPYEKARRAIREAKRQPLDTLVNGLRTRRQERWEYIADRTREKAAGVVSQVPQQADDHYVMFDFAYHKDFHHQVCGEANIRQLTDDRQEQEVVRQCYAGFIAEHSHDQVMTWHRRFSGQEDVLRRLAALENRLAQLTSPQAPPQAESVARPIGDGVVIPEVARGHEAEYRHFLSGKLVYKPNADNDTGRVELPIAALANPLAGMFDISGCGDTGQHLVFNTGFRTCQNPANASKVEVWFAPRFWVEANLGGNARHLAPIFGNWPSTNEVGIFWTWGGWNHGEQAGYYDYLISQNGNDLSNNNLYEKYIRRTPHEGAARESCPAPAARLAVVSKRVGGYPFHKFHIFITN